MLTAKEIRRKYLDFFARHGHDVLPSGPLIPPNDPTLLFTNAGMVPFKKLFLGEERRDVPRVATSQKCLRVSGKHNDLENVGRTARHHTFFEMLGNFSFGDYFKREAIGMAWEFVTGDLALPREKLWVTVFREDDEAAAIWKEVAGLPEERIVRMGEKDNFWTMGDTGPCGPCSEIYIDQGEDMACGPDCGIGKCDCDRYLEIWNLVFTQFDQQPGGARTRLARPNIDTGMGLERIAAVCQGKRSNFDCDLFQDIIGHAAGLAGVSYSFSAPDTNDVDTALRVIADHARSAAFLIADGVLPTNESRGYVLRRLIRRALRFATLMGVHEPFLHKVARKVTEIMGEAYPELVEHADFIDRAVREEEQRFSQTLGNGLEMLEEEMASLAKRNERRIAGEFCFKLSDTYGFPLDIVKDVAEKRGFEVDAEGFERLMAGQRSRARESQKKTGLLGQDGGGVSIFADLAKDGIRSEFSGYGGLEDTGRIVMLLDESGARADEISGKGFVIVSRTPFYGESGGQVGDTGTLSGPDGEAAVTDTLRPAPELIIHCVEMRRGVLRLDQEISLRVQTEERLATARNHTCTHLLHAALRKHLGSHVKQAGSHVSPTRLRFDYSHIAAMTPEELSRVEKEVNAAIMADLPVQCREMPIDEARALGAMALFGEKYGSVVRVVSVGEGADRFSLEFCGGTHLSRTGQAGSLRIVSESGVSAGMRRIEAVTGWNAQELADTQRATMHDLAGLLRCRPDQLAERIQALLADVKKLRKSAEKAAVPASGAADLMGRVEDVAGVRLLAAALPGVSARALRDVMDDVRSRMPSGVACLAGVEDGKVALAVHVSKDLHGRFTAPDLIRGIVEACGGKGGGGRPDMAQAGGSNPDGVNEAFALLRKAIGG